MSTENLYKITGDITFSTVPKLNTVGIQYIVAHQEPIFDLSAVQKTDSSAIALLLAWIRDAKREHKNIHFQNIPHQVLEVAEVCGVSALLSNLA